MLQRKNKLYATTVYLDFFIPSYVLNFLKFIPHIVGQQKSHTSLASDSKAGSDTTVLPINCQLKPLCDLEQVTFPEFSFLHINWVMWKRWSLQFLLDLAIFAKVYYLAKWFKKKKKQIGFIDLHKSSCHSAPLPNNVTSYMRPFLPRQKPRVMNFPHQH